MHDGEKSDDPVVPQKRGNKPGRPGADRVEGRGSTEGHPTTPPTSRAQHRNHDVSRGLERVAEAARRDRDLRFTTLLHHVSYEALKGAYLGLKRRAASGVDGVTWRAYRENYEENLRDLHGRLHRGGYRAKPSRRSYIAKTDGRLRPLGIAALEDKIVQSAVGSVLGAIWEVDFLGFSYGFRPGRHQHMALDALAVAIERRKVNWVLDADIRGYFDAIDHGLLVKMVEHRIADRRVVRLIKKWLTAGVLEDGQWSATKEGTPQGAVISPLLANLYLHYVLDLWVQKWRRTRARGDVVIVRYADDFVVGFEHESDARRFWRELMERLAQFGLELHPDKTRLMEFGRYADERRRRRGRGKPETFVFLGLRHICSKDRQGRFQLRRVTDSKRLNAKLVDLRTWVKRRRHWPVPKLGRWLGAVVRGYCQYHAVPTNSRALERFRRGVIRAWRQALRRRSQRSNVTWKRMYRLADRWLPKTRILHPWPRVRFDARFPR
jgi:group II intron reverse transcriptase/maturase